MKERRERPKWLTVHEGGKKDSGEPQKPVLPEDDTLDFSAVNNSDQEGTDTPSDVPTGFLGADDPSFTLRPEGENWRQIGEVPQEGSDERVMESDLVRVYLDLRDHPPANFKRNVRPERVAEHAPSLRAWTVPALHKYLSTPGLWERPSFTEAVFQEIRARMLAGSMLPRE